MDDTENSPCIFWGGGVEAGLAQSIEDLTQKEKTVISLYYYEELTLKEIGEVLGFTESRICQIHAKAILKLKTKIALPQGFRLIGGPRILPGGGEQGCPIRG